jgi:hypothetical protein
MTGKWKLPTLGIAAEIFWSLPGFDTSLSKKYLNVKTIVFVSMQAYFVCC